MSDKGDPDLRLETIEALSAAHDVPVLDLLMIAANMHGVDADVDIPRARIRLSPETSSEVWQIILPLENPDSPFRLAGGQLRLDGQKVA